MPSPHTSNVPAFFADAARPDPATRFVPIDDLRSPALKEVSQDVRSVHDARQEKTEKDPGREGDRGRQRDHLHAFAGAPVLKSLRLAARQAVGIKAGEVLF